MINVMAVSFCQTLKKGLSIKYVINSNSPDKGLDKDPKF